MKLLKEDGISVNYLQVVYISPLPAKRIAEVINNAKATVIIENNKTAQLAGVIKEQTGLDIDHRILKYDGRPFTPQDIHAGIKELLNTTELKELVFSKHGIIEAR